MFAICWVEPSRAGGRRAGSVRDPARWAAPGARGTCQRVPRGARVLHSASRGCVQEGGGSYITRRVAGRAWSPGFRKRTHPVRPLSPPHAWYTLNDPERESGPIAGAGGIRGTDITRRAGVRVRRLVVQVIFGCVRSG